MADDIFTDLEGVFGNGIAAGIKPNKRDLAYIYVPNAVACAGVFTLNKFIAPCLTYTQKIMKSQVVKAVIINSGNANAGTGKIGLANAKKTSQYAARLLNLKPSEVAVASTGIIGVQLPMDKILSGLDTLLASPSVKEGHAVSDAILTTDLCDKIVHVSCKIGKKNIIVSGIAKGSGMIEPNMGTMLAYFVTNASIPQAQLQVLLQGACDESFNMISVDTDTSTNDMALLFATGEKKFQLVSRVEREAFQNLLTEACQILAKKIARDGEGATKLIEVRVVGASSRRDARKVAKLIVNSPLVKTAMHGEDPNWGRVLMAAGKDPDVKFSADKLSLFFNDQVIVKEGEIVSTREQLAPVLKKETIVILLDLNLGNGHATAWGCDLTNKYIDINTAYS